MPQVLQPNYYVVPCEIKILARVDADSQQKTLSSNYFARSNFTELMGITNFTLNFNLNTGSFRGIGDCVNIRRPTSWEGSFDITRFITSANLGRQNNSGITSLYRLINQGNPSNGYLFGDQGQFAWQTTIGFLIEIPNAAGNKVWRVGIAGLVNNASFSAERDRVEENISITTHLNQTFLSTLV